MFVDIKIVWFEITSAKVVKTKVYKNNKKPKTTLKIETDLSQVVVGVGALWHDNEDPMFPPPLFWQLAVGAAARRHPWLLTEKSRREVNSLCFLLLHCVLSAFFFFFCRFQDLGGKLHTRGPFPRFSKGSVYKLKVFEVGVPEERGRRNRWDRMKPARQDRLATLLCFVLARHANWLRIITRK